MDPDWVPVRKEVKYEYRWSEDVLDPVDADGGGGGGDGNEIEGKEGKREREVFGPFTEEEMRAWYGAAYFGSGGENVEVREVGGLWGDWEEVLGS